MKDERYETIEQSVTNCNHLGNAAKMREALENIAEYAKAAACHTEDAHLLGYLNQIAMWEVWRKEDGGKTAYYEWILAKSTKGETDGSKCARRC